MVDVLAGRGGEEDGEPREMPRDLLSVASLIHPLRVTVSLRGPVALFVGEVYFTPASSP